MNDNWVIICTNRWTYCNDIVIICESKVLCQLKE